MKRATKRDFAKLKRIKADLERIGKEDKRRRKRLGLKGVKPCWGN